MEVFAGFVEHADAQVGRLVDGMEQLGVRDNTIIFYVFGDNGSSAEGQNGTISELLGQNQIPSTIEQQLAALDKIGGLENAIVYAAQKAKLGTGIGYDAKVAAWNYPDPWKGGTWHMGDIVAYQMDALASLTRSAAIDREQFLSDFYKISDHAVHPASGPYAYVISPQQHDPAMAVKLAQTTINWGGKAEPFQGLADWRLQLAVLGMGTVLAYWWLW